jgi:hypothetical protein
LRGVSARLAAFVATAVILAAAGAQAAPSHGGPKVLVDATVADRALERITPEVWTRLVLAYVGGNGVPNATGSTATVEECRAAGDDFLLSAEFDLRPRLPGLANSTDRIAAAAHLQLRNCVTGETTLDRVVNIDADPSAGGDGDFESSAEVTWSKAVPAALAKVPLLGRVARVVRVAPPLAYVDFRGAGLKPGDVLRDYATSEHGAHASAISFTITQVFERYVEVLYSTTGDTVPAVGDLVEATAH